mgnify:CR=1 FL=1
MKSGLKKWELLPVGIFLFLSGAFFYLAIKTDWVVFIVTTQEQRLTAQVTQFSFT